MNTTRGIGPGRPAGTYRSSLCAGESDAYAASSTIGTSVSAGGAVVVLAGAVVAGAAVVGAVVAGTVVVDSVVSGLEMAVNDAGVDRYRCGRLVRRRAVAVTTAC
jgi:hypothetical protein